MDPKKSKSSSIQLTICVTYDFANLGILFNELGITMDSTKTVSYESLKLNLLRNRLVTAAMTDLTLQFTHVIHYLPLYYN